MTNSYELTKNKLNDKELRKFFITSLYSTLSNAISPTPYLEITEGEECEVKLLNGKGGLPEKGKTEISILDLDIASLFFDDIHLLYEGETGMGKTYTSNALFTSIFGKDGYHTIRLSGGVYGASALDPFTTSTLEEGIPKVSIDHNKCQKYGALFIDEVNRGDTNEVFQVLDGTIFDSSGGYGELKLPIVDENNNETGEYKKLTILAAMNPADAQYSTAMQLDLAGENRFLKFKYPNGTIEAGSSQFEKQSLENLHEKFWSTFKQMSGIPQANWRQIYPRVTNSKQFTNALCGKSREFFDFAIGYVGSDPKDTYERNVELIKLAKTGVNFEFLSDSNEYELIKSYQGQLKHGFVRRDLGKIKDLSKLIGFIKGVKNKSYDMHVEVDDIAVSMGIILESKAISYDNEGNLTTLINEARKSYMNLYSELLGDIDVYEGTSIGQAYFESAIINGVDQQNGFKLYQQTIKHLIANINTPAKSIADTVLKSRIVSDLVVLDHFNSHYQEEFEQIFNKTKDPQEVMDNICNLYQKRKHEASIYEHRLDLIIGNE